MRDILGWTSFVIGAVGLVLITISLFRAGTAGRPQETAVYIGIIHIAVAVMVLPAGHLLGFEDGTPGLRIRRAEHRPLHQGHASSPAHLMPRTQSGCPEVATPRHVR